jgi:hypothetical protein
VNPAVANEFIGSAFRFGHGMLQEFYQRLDGNFNSVGGFRFGDGVFQPARLTEFGTDPLIRGLMGTAAKMPQRLTPAVTEQMFGTTDLCSINIQRGREQGIPSYNAWRQFCGLARATTMQDLSREISAADVRQNLQNMYGNPDNIDLYVGAMLEDPVAGAMIGPTFACIVGNQFQRTRDGDRLYYEAPGVFSDAQLAQIRQFSFSRLICDSGEGFGSAPRDSFLFTTFQSVAPCNTIPGIDLSAWRE